jgi:hypothetical protein
MANNAIMIPDSSISAQLMKQEGAMKAYQSVAQSTALAIQDAVDNLRNINTISATVMGVAMAQMLADPPTASQYESIVTNAENMATAAAANFLTIGQNAATVLSGFPTGQ